MLRSRFFIASIFLFNGLGFSADEKPGLEPAPALNTAELLKNKIGKSKYDLLVSKNLLPNIEQEGKGDAHCGLADALTVGEKAALSDIVVFGEITKVKFLYREGGPFRTQYGVKVAESLKGEVDGEIQILSIFGPISRDHRRWRSDGTPFQFEAGDKGFFFLSNDRVQDFQKRFPEHDGELSGKFTFLAADRFSAYLVKNGQGKEVELDRTFLTAAGHKGKVADIKEIRQSLAVINESLRMESKRK